MLWKDGKANAAAPAAAGDNVPAPIDPASEAAKIREVTGDKPVIIAREKSPRIKLPGL